MSTSNNITKYLEDYHSGKITLGKDTGLVKLDDSIRFKNGQLTIINGLDNVGKSVWMLWYFLTLSVKHNLKWHIWGGENKAGQLVRQLIQFLTGRKLSDLSLQEVYRYEVEICKLFNFVDNTKFYKLEDLLKIFEDSDCDGCLIDPFTGLNRGFNHSDNYDFLNTSRDFSNRTGKSLYVNTHVVSEAARRVYADSHPEFAGYPFPPSKSQSEGGQPFGNRTDDFITIHRLVGHPSMNYKTLIYIRKIKDTETGGMVTPIDQPLEFEFNGGLGFTLDGQNILSQTKIDDIKLPDLTHNTNFDNEDIYENPPF